MLSVFIFLCHQSPELFHLTKMKLLPMKQLFHLLPPTPPTGPANHHFIFCFYKFDYSRALVQIPKTNTKHLVSHKQ